MIKADDLAKILSAMGVDVVRVTHDKVVCKCPFAKWTHTGGSDSSPSFAFYRSQSGRWRYNCFTCKEKGGGRGFS